MTAAGAPTLAALGVPTAVATASFANETTLAATIDAGRLRPGTAAVIYAPGASRATPAAQQADPGRYSALAGQVAHAHGLLLIAAPQISLATRRATVPAGAVAGDRQAARAAQAAFLRLGIATATAPSADVFDVPAQGTEGYAKDYAAFVAAAGRQATRAHPGIELLAGLDAGRPGAGTGADALFDAYLSTRLTVAGYELDAPGSAAPAAAFLRRLDHLS